MIPEFAARNSETLLRDASMDKPQRVTPFLNDVLGFALTEYYGKAGINEYDWHPFGPDMKNAEWNYFSFDPPGTQPHDDGKPRYLAVTYPDGMANWFAPDFDSAAADWKRGSQPFGQLGGELEPLSSTCNSPFCGCGTRPRTLWENEVLLIQQTFDVPPLRDGHRYRIVVGGSAHVSAGEGYAIYINGQPLIEYPNGVARRQGGQPRGAFIDNEIAREFESGRVTIAATSFLRYHHPREGVIPPRGHFSIWLEEMRIPPVVASR